MKYYEKGCKTLYWTLGAMDLLQRLRADMEYYARGLLESKEETGPELNEYIWNSFDAARIALANLHYQSGNSNLAEELGMLKDKLKPKAVGGGSEMMQGGARKRRRSTMAGGKY
jgi:hypothetical protein